MSSGLAMWHNFLLVLRQGKFLLGETLPQHGSTAWFVGYWVGQKCIGRFCCCQEYCVILRLLDCCIQVKFPESCGLAPWCNNDGVSRDCYRGGHSIVVGSLVFVKYRNVVCISHFGDADECGVQSWDYIHFSCPFL